MQEVEVDVVSEFAPEEDGRVIKESPTRPVDTDRAIKPPGRVTARAVRLIEGRS